MSLYNIADGQSNQFDALAESIQHGIRDLFSKHNKLAFE